MQPVAIWRAVFCVVCSLFMCVFALSLCHAVCVYVGIYKNILFVYSCNVFLGVSISSVSEGADVVQSVFGFCVVLISSLCCLNVIPPSNVTARILVLCVAKCYLWLCSVFCVARCNECEKGFVFRDLHSIVGEPLF